jgi:hypothetical protein
MTVHHGLREMRLLGTVDWCTYIPGCDKRRSVKAIDSMGENKPETADFRYASNAAGDEINGRLPQGVQTSCWMSKTSGDQRAAIWEKTKRKHT